MAKRNAPKQTNPAADDYRAKLVPSSLIQDVRDFFLRSVRENGMKTPWSKMSEGEQTLEIERAEQRAEQLVHDVVHLVSEGNFRAVPATVDNFKIKGEGVVIQIKALRDDDNLLALNHAGSQAVSLVIVDMDQFDQHRQALRADPDEPGLPGIKQELQPEEVRDAGGAEQDPNAVQDPNATPAEPPKPELDEEALAKVSDTLPAEDHTAPIHDMRGKEGGPIECYRGDVRWWSPDGKEWRLATEADVYPDDLPPATPTEPEEPAAFEDDGTTLEEQEQEQGGDILDQHLDAMKGGAGTIEQDGETFDGETGEQLSGDIGQVDAPTTTQPTLSPTGEEPSSETPEPQEPTEPTQDQIIFWQDQGAKARKDGFAPGKSPYAKDTAAWTHWQAGYKAEKQRERDAEQKGVQE